MATGTWQNSDGLLVKFPAYYAANPRALNRPRALNIDGAIKQIEVDIDLTLIPTGTVSYSSDLDNDGTLDGFNTGDAYLPANSSVLRATLIAVTAATGGTSFTIGTYGLTGSAIAATGLVTATEGVIANINTIGKRVYGAGALVATTAGTAGVGTADAYIGVATTGTFTAGKVKLIVEYIQPLPDA